MWFLFLQIWVWLLAAFILGWFAHWFFCCRGKNKVDDQSLKLAESQSSAEGSQSAAEGSAIQAATVNKVEIDEEQSSFATVENDQSGKPMLFAQAPENSDDLTQIKGVGEVLEGTLQSLGVYQFEQIANWTDEHVAWMDNYLSFTGRIDREDWRSQAKKLVKADT